MAPPTPSTPLMNGNDRHSISIKDGHIPQLCSMTQNSSSTENTISVIDLQGLEGARRTEILKQIEHACRINGFFQVVNHGVAEVVAEEMKRVAREFFTMEEELREELRSEDPTKDVRLSSSFNVNRERMRKWRQYLRLQCYPLHRYVHEWPRNPADFRQVTANYCKQMQELALRLLSAISESLGLQPRFLSDALGEHAQHMAINYYAPCPCPSSTTFGLPEHTDPNALTLLLTDTVPGLEALDQQGNWVSVHHVPNAFVVNIGDQIQVLSNGLYKSGVHRAVVNPREARISIPTFYSPSADALIQPAAALVTPPHNPQRYSAFHYRQYFAAFWDNSLECSTLEPFTLPLSPSLSSHSALPSENQHE